ncbi:MAG: hypothetical protein ACO3A2_08395, partial [Bdellovibrionia bacterium]
TRRGSETARGSKTRSPILRQALDEAIGAPAECLKGLTPLTLESWGAKRCRALARRHRGGRIT